MSPNLDKQQVILRLQHLKEYLKILKLLQKFSLKEIDQDPFKKGALLHYLQLSAEICIDIGQMILVAENFVVPDESAKIFIILGDHKWLPKKFAEEFSAVARFRNLLVHEYVEINIAKVYSYLHDELKDFEFFAQAIIKYIRSA